MEIEMTPKMLASEAAEILGVTIQAIHKQLKSKNLPYFKLKNRIYFSYETAKQMFIDFISPCLVVVFVLVKGGVGKSTLCRETAIQSTLMGKRTLILEIDHQGNLTKSFEVNAQNYPVLIDLFEKPELDIKKSIVNVIPGLDILPSRYDNCVLDNFLMLKRVPLQKAIKEKVEQLRKDYDLILIDCPPNLGQAVASAVLCSDLIVMPTTPCDFSDSGVDITNREIKKMLSDYDAKDIPRKIILNKFDNREKDSRETHANLLKHEEYGDMMFGGYIRKCKEIETYRKRKSSVFESISVTVGREDIHTFTCELLGMNDLPNKALKNEIEDDEKVYQSKNVESETVVNF